MSRTTDMTVGSPTKHILTFALPLIVTNFGQQLYTIADASIVGRGVGVQALAAVGATDWSYWLILWSIMGLVQGFSTSVARYFGDKDFDRTNKTIAMSALLSAVIAVLMTIGGLLAVKPALKLLNTPADIMDGASTYLRIMVGGTLIVTAYNLSAAILRAFGDGRSPLIAMVIAALMNIGLDLVFVFVFHWGIAGAAIASVTSQLVSFLYCLAQMRKIDYIQLTPDTWKPDWRQIKDLLLFAAPLGIQHIAIALGGILLQSSVNTQGSTFIAGYTATNKVYGLLESSAFSVGLACSTFLSQNYGAKNLDRVKKGTRTGVYIVIVLAIVIMTATLLARQYILQLFLDIHKPGGSEALAIGIRYLTIVASCLVVLYLIHVYRNALQAMEISYWSLISGITECFCRVFMAKMVYHWIGSNALFIAEPFAWLGALLAVMIPYFYYRKKLLN